MNVYLFKLSKDYTRGSGQALVAAHDASEAWDVLEKEIGWVGEFFDKESCDHIRSLNYVLDEPMLITYNWYIE